MPKTAKKKAPKRIRAVVIKEKKELLDPRQALFLNAYIDPKSKTFGNAYQSALGAGYSENYATTITAKAPEWLEENGRRERRIALAEKHLDEVLDLPIKVQAMGAFGPIVDKKTKKPVMVNSMEVVKQKTKVMEFALERLDKKNYGKDSGVKIGFQFNIAGAKENYTHD